MKSKNASKCKCYLNNKITCANCSTVKMVILLKNGNNELKYFKNGEYYSPVWYSYLSKNKKPFSNIIEKMYNRFQKDSKYKNSTNKLIFYNNRTKEVLKEFLI